ncbi:hypothetical protein [Marinobacter sp. NSM]|uniref:hypothetical protein n=1 Tax=Marinobacter sp. NSM TaxID=3458004 RepID=UPI00403609F8
MTEYKTRTTQLVVHPANDSSTFSEMATRVSIDDEGGGEFLKVEQTNTGAILINPGEWPAIREAIDRMAAECRSEQ